MAGFLWIFIFISNNQKQYIDCKKNKLHIYRAEGGIEPLGYYTATDLKSAHLTREDHPRTQ